MNLYGIFANNSNRWGMVRNKRKAIRIAKRNPGTTVRVLADCPEHHCFDAPTFRTLSTQIFPVSK